MRIRLLVLAATAVTTLVVPMAGSASASVYCQDLGPLPGWGPVCTVRCVLGTDPEVNPKNLPATLESLIPICPA